MRLEYMNKLTCSTCAGFHNHKG